MSGYRTYLACFALSFLLTWVLTPLVMRLAQRVGAVDRPVNRKIHHRTVPRLGGVALFLGMWIPLVLLTFYDNFVVQQILADEVSPFLILLGGFAMLGVGVIDDIWGLNSRWKLSVQFPVAIALVSGGVRFETLSLPFLGSWDLGLLGPFVSVFWLVGVTNAVNLIDGVDGLAGGVGYLISVTLAIVAIWTDNILLLVMMLALSGSCLGFLRYNLDPARVFLGDSGSLFLGMTLAVAAVLGTNREGVGGALLTSFILLGYPIADTLISMTRRYLRGKPIFAGDANHIHHRLLYRGLDHRRVCLVIHGVCLVFCLWSLALARQHLISMIATTALAGVVVVAGAYYLGYLRYWLIPKLAGDRNYYKAAFHYAEMIKAKMGIAATREELMTLLQSASREFGQTLVEVQLPGNRLGPALDGTPLSPEPEATPAGHTPARRLEDRYAYKDSGLVVRVTIGAKSSPDQLVTERRRLLGEVCEAADRRLVAMLRALDNEDLRIRIEAPLRARATSPHSEGVSSRRIDSARFSPHGAGATHETGDGPLALPSDR